MISAFRPLAILLLASSRSRAVQTPDVGVSSETIGCYAQQYVDNTIAPAVRQAQFARARIGEFRKGKRSVQEGYQLLGRYYTILKLLAPTIGQASGIQEYDQDGKFRARIAALIPELMAKRPELRDFTASALEGESKAVEAEYSSLVHEHRELRAGPFAHWYRSVAELDFAGYDDAKLSSADASPESLFPCLSPEKRTEAMQMLNFSVDMDFGEVVGADQNVKEMNDRLKEYHAGKRPPREGYIVLFLLGSEYSRLYSALHNGASHHPYERETGLVMRYRIQSDGKFAQFTPGKLKKNILATYEEIGALLQKHPELSQVKEFGLNMLQYVKP